MFCVQKFLSFHLKDSRLVRDFYRLWPRFAKEIREVKFWEEFDSFYWIVGVFRRSIQEESVRMDPHKYGIVKLNNTNYYNWKFKMQLILVKEKLWKYAIMKKNLRKIVRQIGISFPPFLKFGLICVWGVFQLTILSILKLFQ